MKKLSILLATLVLLTSGMFIGAAPVLADESCSHTKIRLYEHTNLNGDYRDFCGDIADLNNWTHTQAGLCGDAILGDNSWDDCASSFKVIANSHRYCVSIFSNPRGPLQWPLLEGGFLATGYWSNFDGNENDTATSIDWWQTDVCPGNP